jgi:hypothetical protein
VPSLQRRVEFVDRQSDHQVIPDDAAAHPTLTEKGEAAEHLSLGEARPVDQRSADAVCESFVVRHEGRMLLTVGLSHLLAVMASVKLHEPYVVLDRHGAKDRGPHPDVL